MASKPVKQGQHKNGREATAARVAAWKAKFVAALAKAPDVTAAAKVAGIDRVLAYRQRKSDAEFAAAWDDALEQAVDAAEHELYRRGVEGYDKPVYQQGEMVGTIREFSDTLLIAFLKARRREYRDQRNAIINIDWNSLTDEQITRLADGEDPVSVLTSSGAGAV